MLVIVMGSELGIVSLGPNGAERDLGCASDFQGVRRSGICRECAVVGRVNGRVMPWGGSSLGVWSGCC